MSLVRQAIGSLALCAAFTPCTASAQATAEEALETARRAYRVTEPRRVACPQGEPGVIVVCQQRIDPDNLRVPSETDRAVAAGQAVDDGVPRAPDLYGGMAGGVTVMRGCFVPPCPPPAAIMIDLEAIPEPLTPEQARAVRRAEPTPEPGPDP